ncbi:MAG: 2-phospho-L-lactate transferase [Anaerolineales bacterium]
MRITALAGGVGGAKLAHGLAQLLSPQDLTIIVNTGDDFEHFGLYISPDLDTVCYTLAGLANPVTGWGRADETWNALDGLKRLGAPDWFALGDRDLATHLERTRRLKEGQTLSQITRAFCQAWGVRHTILPMSDAPVRTIVDTVEYGELPFQEYFVRHRCEPRVKGFRFEGIESARPASGVLAALQEADAILICPSNPWVSIDPILRLLGLSPTDRRPPSTVHRPSSAVAVSPIIGGKTVKGPAAKMFAELGIEPSALAVAEHYRGLLTGFVLDTADAALAENIQRRNVQTLITDTLMNSPADRRRLAQDVLNFIRSIHSPTTDH